MVKSPLSGKASSLVFKVDINKLIKDYASSFGIDILPLIPENTDLGLYEDVDSGFKFYYPFTVSGDDAFYQSLNRFDWYYMPWKWEHEISLEYVKPNTTTLEVGCGAGGFLKRLSTIVGRENIEGLEMNSDVVAKLQSEGYLVHETDIADFAESNKERFDLVCSYQVLEHISDVKDFIRAKILCLKKGGKLIISVPNNDSTLLENTNGGALNFPPHHQGLWNKKSLKALEGLFPIKLEKLYFEPIQDYHWNWYLSIIDRKLESKPFNSVIRRLPNFKKGLHMFLKAAKPAIKGHTILAVYKKI